MYELFPDWIVQKQVKRWFIYILYLLFKRDRLFACNVKVLQHSVPGPHTESICIGSNFLGREGKEEEGGANT